MSSKLIRQKGPPDGSRCTHCSRDTTCIVGRLEIIAPRAEFPQRRPRTAIGTLNLLVCSISSRLSSLSCHLRNLLVLLLVISSELTAASVLATQDPDVEVTKQELIHKLSERFPEEEISAIFSDSRLEVDKSVIPPKRYRPPVKYYKSILSPDSVRDGKSYVERYAFLLSGAQQRYGIPREVIAGILRIETNFGRNAGRRRVINSLYSLYVLVPKRKDFALRELGTFVSL